MTAVICGPPPDGIARLGVSPREACGWMPGTLACTAAHWGVPCGHLAQLVMTAGCEHESMHDCAVCWCCLGTALRSPGRTCQHGGLWGVLAIKPLTSEGTVTEGEMTG